MASFNGTLTQTIESIRTECRLRPEQKNPLRLSWISEISRQILSTLSCQLLRGFRWHTHIHNSNLPISNLLFYDFVYVLLFSAFERFRTFIHISWKYWNVRFPPFKLWNKFSSLMVYHAEKWWAHVCVRALFFASLVKLSEYGRHLA